MTSTESTSATTTSATTIATSSTTSGKFGNVEDIQDENVLREMWQDMEDGDAKRQVRSRMYKLREERLKEYYGREGQDILDSILKQPLETEEDVEGGIQEERRVITTESFRTEGTGGVSQQSKTVKQTKVVKQQQVQSGSGENAVSTIVTTTTTTASGGGGGGGENIVSRTTKSRIINKERGNQLEEVRSQQRASPKRNVSSSESGGVVSRPLSKRSSVESDISVTKGSKSKNMTNGVASKRKQTTTTTVTTTSSGGGSGASGRMSTTRTSTTTVSTDDKGDAVTAVVDEVVPSSVEPSPNRRNENRVAALSRNFQDQISSQQNTVSSSSMTRNTVMSSSSVMMSSSSTFGSVGGATTRMSTVNTVISSSGGGQDSLFQANENNQLGDGSNLDVGKVVIKEIEGVSGGRGSISESASTATRRSTTTTTATSASSRGGADSKTTRTTRQNSGSASNNRRDANNLTNGLSSTSSSQADRKSTRTSSIMTTNNKASTVNSSSAKSTNNRTTSSSNRSPSRSSHNNQSNTAVVVTAVDKKDGSFSSSMEAQEKLCRRTQRDKLSRESSPKSRTSRRQVPPAQEDDNLQSTCCRRKHRETSSASSSPTRRTTTSSTRATHAVSERSANRPTSPSKETPVAKAAATTTTTATRKDEETEKTTKITEEKIMRELDILDTYLSQRSASIDEGNNSNTRGEESAVTATTTTTTTATSPSRPAKMNGPQNTSRVVGEERKARKSDKNFSSLGKSESTSTARNTTIKEDSERVDVMESGVEPPFTRTVYKRNCPDDHPHDHPNRPRRGHSPDKSPDRNRSSAAPKKESKSNNEMVADLEDEIIATEAVIAAATTTTTPTSSRRADRSTNRATGNVTPQKTTSSSPAKVDKSTRPKRTPSQSPEKTKRNTNTPSSSPTSKTPDVISSTTTPNPETSSISRGRKPTGRTTSSSTTATTTRSNSRTGLSKKTDVDLNVKTGGAVEEVITSTHVTSVSQDRRSDTGTKQTMTDAEKYEADILSRPSVFTARKATAVKGVGGGSPVTSSSRPNPNPRTRKGSDSSPEREIVRAAPIQRTAHEEDDLDDDNPLNPSKRFTPTVGTGSTGNKHLESPGAVLKAKSLFETKAQEAAKDRSSIELGSKVSTSPKLTVSRKAALFEARSRGERISISSDEEEESNEKVEDEWDDGKNVSQGEQSYKTCRIPEASEVTFSMERRASQVVTVVQKEEQQQLVKQHQTIIESATDTTTSDVTETDKVSRGKSETRRDSRNPSPPRATSRPTARPSPPKEIPQKREKSPSRLVLEKSDRITDRRKSSAITGRTSESPERPLPRRASEATAQMLAKNSNTNGFGVVGTIRTVHRTVIEENNNNNQRRGSIGILTTVDKRNSLGKVDRLPIEAPIDLVDLKRKDSRGISMASSKIIIQNQQQRKALQDIEQKMSNDGIIIRNHVEEEISDRELSPSPPPQSPRKGSNNNIISNTATTISNQALSSELKSTNVVKQATRRHQQQQKTESSSSTVRHSSPEPHTVVSEELPETTITTSKPPSPRRSSPPACRRASKSPERSASPPRSKVTTSSVESATITAERRRSSKVEAIVASLKQSSSSGTSSTVTTTTTSSSSNRMTTAELNAIEEMDNLDELEALLDKATDYDERSKIRGRIRFLKRKATLVKRVSDYSGSDAASPTEKGQKATSPLRGTTTGASTTTTRNGTATSTTTAASSVERRASKENKVTSTSRKSSSNDLLLQENKRVTSRKSSSDELMKKSTGKPLSSTTPSEKDKENRRIEEGQTQSPGNRGTSPQKSDRQSSPTGTAATTATTSTITTTATQRKNVERSSSSQRIQSRSNSGRIGKINNSNDEKGREETSRVITSLETGAEGDHHQRDRDQRPGTELKRKLSTETSELLSTRNYSRDHERQQQDKRNEEQVISPKTVVADQDLYSSRRNSRNLEEDDDGDIDRVRKSKVITKSGSPSPTTSRRRLKQTDEEKEDLDHQTAVMKEKSSPSGSGSASPKSKPSSRATSPQRSEIPISSRMKRERSLSPPRRMASPPKEPPTSETQSGIDRNEKSEQVTENETRSENKEDVKEEQQQQQQQGKVEEDKETSENVKGTAATTTTSATTTVSTSRKVSSRKSSATEITGDEKTTGRTTSSHERKPSSNQRITDAEKYEADILSRPSVFAARRAVAATTAAKTTETTTTEKSEPSRATSRKSPSPDRETTRVTTSSQRTTTRETTRSSPVVTRGDSSRSITSSTKATSEDSQSTPVTRKQSTDENNKSSSRGSNAYTRKGSSKELTKRVSKGVDETETVTKSATEASNQPVATTEAVITTSKSSTENDKKVTSDNRSSTRVTSRTVTTTANTVVSADTDQQKPSRVTTRSSSPPSTAAVPGNTSNKTPLSSSSSTTTTTTTRRTTGGSTFSPQKSNTTSAKKVTERVQSTDIVTSSYGTGPVDDDGKPLFGLRALRKIKQAEEQAATATPQEDDVPPVDNVERKTTTSTTTQKRDSSNATNKISTSTFQDDIRFSPALAAASSVTTNLQSLRSNDMYGLRALRKQAAESNRDSSDNEQAASPSSTRAPSVEKDRRSSNMSSSKTMTTSVTTSSSTLSTQQQQKSNSSSLANERVNVRQQQSLTKKKSSSEEEELEEEDDDDEDEELQTCADNAATSPTPSSTTTTTTSTITTNERKVSSPKSILKKTSSFTTTSSNSSSSGSSSVRKNSGSGGREEPSLSPGREPIPESVKEVDTSVPRSSGTTTASSSARSSVERKISGKIITSQDDESWRRQRSHSPSPKLPASASTASSIATFSRGKVGRSSVREMSKRFETGSDNDEQQDNVMSKSSSATSLTTTSRGGRESSPSSCTTTTIIRTSRAESPSRIPLSIKSTTTTVVTSTVSSATPSGNETMGNDNDDDHNATAIITRDNTQTCAGMTGAVSTTATVESFETTGGPIICRDEDGGQVSFQGSQQQKVEQQRHFEKMATATGGSISISSSSNVVQSRRIVTTTTTSSSPSASLGRSFLNDQSPIQNLEDVITRMRGEDPELMRPFVEEQADGDDNNGTVRVIQQNSNSSNQGRNLLNKFIGAQVIMQAVEPMLIAQQKVSMSMSSSLEQSGTTHVVEPEEKPEEDSSKTEENNVSEMLGNCQIEELEESSTSTQQTRPLGVSGSVEITEESSSQLTQEASTASETSSEQVGSPATGGTTVSATAATAADVTGELMPLILGQLQSSLDSITSSSASSSASTALLVPGGGGGASSSGDNISIFGGDGASSSASSSLSSGHYSYHSNNNSKRSVGSQYNPPPQLSQSHNIISSHHHHHQNRHNSSPCIVSGNNNYSPSLSSSTTLSSVEQQHNKKSELGNSSNGNTSCATDAASTEQTASTPSSSSSGAANTGASVDGINFFRSCEENGVFGATTPTGLSANVPQHPHKSSNNNSSSSAITEDATTTTATAGGGPVDHPPRLELQAQKECLFDSGTESGGISAIDDEEDDEDDDEDTVVVLEEPSTSSTVALLPATTSQYDDTGTEFSSFLQGLKNSLKKSANKESPLRSYYNYYGGEGGSDNGESSGAGAVSSSSGDRDHISQDTPPQGSIDFSTVSGTSQQTSFSSLEQENSKSNGDIVKSGCGQAGQGVTDEPGRITTGVNASEREEGSVGDDSGLMQQVDKVLTLLRASLLKDPQSCLAQISGNPADTSNPVPDFSNNTPNKGKELIALIDRLKSSLTSEQQQNEKENSFNETNNPAGAVGQSKDEQVNHNSSEKVSVTSNSENTAIDQSSKMLGCAQQAHHPQYQHHHHDISPFPPSRSSSNPWVAAAADFSASSERINSASSNLSLLSSSTDQIPDSPTASTAMVEQKYSNLGQQDAINYNVDGNGVPWKIRLAKRRSQPRSHTVGVTQEELAQARRLFEEATGFRLDHHVNAPSSSSNGGSGYPRQEELQQYQQPIRYNNSNASLYSQMQDLSSLGNGNNNKSSNNNKLDDDDDDVFLRSGSNINNYGESGGDAGVVGTVPAYVNPISPSASQSHHHQQQQSNLPLSPSSSSLPFVPHDFSCSLEDVGMMSTGGSVGGRDKHQTAAEMMPSGGGGVGGTGVSTAPTTPNWQTDVEKRLTSMPRPFVPFVKNTTQFYEGYQPPPERRMTYASIDDSVPMPGGVMGNLKIKPYRTYSLDSNKPSSNANNADDPSKSLFTPQESVQIAIHQAAIKKQMSEEEDRRKRRNSLTSNQQYGANNTGGGSPGVKQDILLPKPYSPPKQYQQMNQNTTDEISSSPNDNNKAVSSSGPQNNGYSSMFQSGADSGYTEESGTETNQKDDKPAMQSSYDSSPVGPMAIVPFSSSSSSNGVVNISSGNSNGRLNDSMTCPSANTITYTTSGGFVPQQQQQQHQHQQQQQQSPKRIENVQISLKELNSSEFPQLQIAITLNTNNGPSNENGKGTTTVAVVDGGGGPNSSYVSRIPNVTATSTATTVTTNLQLGGGGSSSSGYMSGGNGRSQSMEVAGSGSQYFSNDEGQQTSASLSRAIRYKSKNERKKRMKRANTIDIPHPPGLLLQNQNNDDDDTTGMEDEEDSDSNNYGRMMKNMNSNNNSGGVNSSGGGNCINNQAGKYQPFQPKTEGDRKFLAFLEKNNALSDQGSSGIGRPLRPSHLGVSHDRQWLSRFSNLKTSFESSSQGSSPSASPIPSPLRPPRSVSEMALTQERRGGASSADSFSKPVWANTDKSQLPPQVRNKLHVFENRSFDSPSTTTTTADYPHWRSPPPPAAPAHHGWQQQQQHQQHSNQFGGVGNRGMIMPGMKQTVSTNALNQFRGGGQPSSRGYNRPAFSSHDNMALVGQKKISFQGNSFDSKLQQQQQPYSHNAAMRRPTPVKLQPHLSSNNTKADANGVHMVHATAAALEAMKKSGFVPASSASSVVPVQNVSHPQQQYQPKKVIQDDKIDLPWAKRGHDSPVLPSSSASSRDPSRVQSSKARFEQPPVSSSPAVAPQMTQHHAPTQMPPTSSFHHQAPATAPTNSNPATTTASQQHQQYHRQQYGMSGKTSSSLDSPPGNKYAPHHVDNTTVIPTTSSSSGFYGGGPVQNSTSNKVQQLSSSSSITAPVTGVGSQQQQQALQQMGGSAEDFVPVVRPSLKSFGVTQSFDEAFKRKLDQQIASGSVMYSDEDSHQSGGGGGAGSKVPQPQQQQQLYPVQGESSGDISNNRSPILGQSVGGSLPSLVNNHERVTIGQSNLSGSMSNSINSTNMPFELQQSSGSAFARQVPISITANNAEPPSSTPFNQQTSPVKTSPGASSGVSAAVNANTGTATPAGVVGDDGLILTPVVARVMRGPQQQRATYQNRMSSLQDDQQNTRLTGARSNLRNFLNIHQAASAENMNSKQDEHSPSSPHQMKFSSSSQGSLLNLPPLTKSLSGDAILLNNSQNSIIKPALPTTPSHDNSNDAPPPTAEVRRSQQQNATTTTSTPPQSSSISSSSNNRNESPPTQQQRPVIIPRQKSLSEFPKVANNPPPKIEPLTIETDLLRLTKQASVNNSNNSRMSATNNHPVQPQHNNNMSQHQQRPVGPGGSHPQQQPQQHQHHHKPQASVLLQQQQSKTPITQQPHHHPHHHQQQQQQTVIPKTTTRSYPDSLHRTSSGSSIFSRAKNLFFGSQDGGPPSTKLRPKLPTLSTSPQSAKLTFPKQFEAQMSPDSADRKQRELAAYFKQQFQQQEMLQRQGASAVLGGGNSGGKLRKSASHSKIMHRQRSLSDGDEDVDAIFESLFKASGTPNPNKK